MYFGEETSIMIKASSEIVTREETALGFKTGIQRAKQIVCECFSSISFKIKLFF
jgi:hypothetical protein